MGDNLRLVLIEYVFRQYHLIAIALIDGVSRVLYASGLPEREHGERAVVTVAIVPLLGQLSSAHHGGRGRARLARHVVNVTHPLISPIRVEEARVVLQRFQSSMPDADRRRRQQQHARHLKRLCEATRRFVEPSAHATARPRRAQPALNAQFALVVRKVVQRIGVRV